MLHLINDANHEAYCELTTARFALMKVVGCPIAAKREVVNGMCAVGINPETGLQTVWVDVISGDADATRYERTFTENPDAGFVYQWALEMMSKLMSHTKMVAIGFSYDLP